MINLKYVLIITLAFVLYGCDSVSNAKRMNDSVDVIIVGENEYGQIIDDAIWRCGDSVGIVAVIHKIDSGMNTNALLDHSLSSTLMRTVYGGKAKFPQLNLSNLKLDSAIAECHSNCFVNAHFSQSDLSKRDFGVRLNRIDFYRPMGGEGPPSSMHCL